MKWNGFSWDLGRSSEKVNEPSLWTILRSLSKIDKVLQVMSFALNSITYSLKILHLNLMNRNFRYKIPLEHANSNSVISTQARYYFVLQTIMKQEATTSHFPWPNYDQPLLLRALMVEVKEKDIKPYQNADGLLNVDFLYTVWSCTVINLFSYCSVSMLIVHFFLRKIKKNRYPITTTTNNNNKNAVYNPP